MPYTARVRQPYMRCTEKPYSISIAKSDVLRNCLIRIFDVSLDQAFAFFRFHFFIEPVEEFFVVVGLTQFSHEAFGEVL